MEKVRQDQKIIKFISDFDKRKKQSLAFAVEHNF